MSLTGVKNSFGSPSFPSPLDRIRTGKRERAAQLGLSMSKKDSFEINQSFPKTTRAALADDLPSPVDPVPQPQPQPDNVKCTLEDFKGIHTSSLHYPMHKIDKNKLLDFTHTCCGQRVCLLV